MLKAIQDWFGFGAVQPNFGAGGHDEGAHGHTHGVIDPTIATTAKGIWAIKWSFVILAITSALQLVVVYFSGSVALLADTIHNVGDAVTAIPLWIAFMLARRKPSKTFTYGLGRVEDLAGIAIVLIILFSALFAGYQALDRLYNPQAIQFLGWVAAAGLIGFIGNEAVAVFRIRTGREINSAALIADGYHARTDGFTSLAVVLGALGVWLGYPLADPIIGLLITIAIFGIVWQSSKAVFTRMLDGIEPAVIDEIQHVAEHVKGITGVGQIQARWIGHRQQVDMAIAMPPSATVGETQSVIAELQSQLFAHLPALSAANIRLAMPAGKAKVHEGGHHHAPDPFRFESDVAAGVLEIVDTAEGERMLLTLSNSSRVLNVEVVINRKAGPERIRLEPLSDKGEQYQSSVAPAEPHEFEAQLILTQGRKKRELAFVMKEPEGHH